MFKRAFDFLVSNWRKMLTFMVGLAFICAVCWCVGLIAKRIYRVFVPDNIYSDPSYATNLDGASVYEGVFDETVEEGSTEFFETYIGNMIKQDMPDFDDPLDLNDEYIISYGLWQAITLNNTQGGIYTYDDKGRFRVPADDVEMFATYCFDFPRKMDHRTVEICGEFKYNIFNKTYTVASAGVESSLIPDVINVETGENDTYIITVDCYDDNMLSADPTNDPMNFKKRVLITLQDMGQTFAVETGAPIHRYIFLSMDTVNLDEQEEEETQASTDKE